MTKPPKIKRKASADKPVLTDIPIYKNYQPVGFIALEGDAAKGQADGK